MIRRWIRKIAVLISVLGFAGLAIVVARTNPEPWRATEVAHLTMALNEAAAIGVPHDFLMEAEMRDAHRALLVKVETGEPLTTAEDIAYRQIFQTVLQRSQNFLGRFDRELSVLRDHAMTEPNNTAAHGIAGDHDHHDLSARKNFSELLTTLQNFETATSSVTRIYYAGVAQKDLVDLISHLGVAPHTVSVPYVPPDQPWPDQKLGAEFENMVAAFKSAQFLPINGAEYWMAIDLALQHYAALILDVQQRVHNRTSSWERKVSGRFNSLQTLAPPVDLNRPLRRK